MTPTQSTASGVSSSQALGENLTGTALPSQIAWTAVRVIVGSLMIHNGLDKLADVPGFANGVVAFMGIPFPIFFTYCAAYTEIISSILLILGAVTQFSALSLLLTMLMALYFHLKKTGLEVPEFEMAGLYASFYLLFAIHGGGKFSVDALWKQWRNKEVG